MATQEIGVVLTAASAEGVCLVVALAEAGSSLRWMASQLILSNCTPGEAFAIADVLIMDQELWKR